MKDIMETINNKWFYIFGFFITSFILNLLFLSTPETQYFKTIISFFFVSTTIFLIWSSDTNLNIGAKELHKFELLGLLTDLAIFFPLLDFIYLDLTTDKLKDISRDWSWLFPSHNSAGFFFCILCTFKLNTIKFKREKIYELINYLSLIVAIFFLHQTGSRSSCLAFYIALFIIISRSNLPSLFKLIFSILLGLVSLLFFEDDQSLLLATLVISLLVWLCLFRKFAIFPLIILCFALPSAFDFITLNSESKFKAKTNEIIYEEYQLSDEREKNVSIRIKIWMKAIEGKNVFEIVFGNINFECDESLRFIAHEGAKQQNYNCSNSYFANSTSEHEIFQSSHNSIIYIFSKSGLVGVLFFLGFIVLSLKRFKNLPEIELYFLVVMIYGVGTNGIFSFIGSFLFLLILLSSITLAFYGGCIKKC